MAVPLILYSGGLDSTFLLQEQLKVGPCDVLYINGGQHQDKIKLELEHRQKNIAIFNRCYPHKIQCQFNIEESLNFSMENNGHGQPLAWLIGSLKAIDISRHSVLKIAYVSGDTALPSIDKITTAWNGLQGLLYEPIPIQFPLVFTKKVEILERIDKRLLENVWVCEAPVDMKACKKCRPCRVSKHAYDDFKFKHGITVKKATAKALKGFKEEYYYADNTRYHYKLEGVDCYQFPV